MPAPDLPMRERIAEALWNRRKAWSLWVPWPELTNPGLREKYLAHADAVLDLWADLPDTAVEAGAKALTEPSRLPGLKMPVCVRHHRVIFNNGCPACNKEARAVLVATITAIKEKKA